MSAGISSGRLFAKGMLRSHILTRRIKRRIISQKDLHLMPSFDLDAKSKVGKVIQFYELGGESTYSNMCVRSF